MLCADTLMPEERLLQPEHQTSIRDWEQTAPWIRRFSMRAGLEGKLVLCFMAVLCAAMGVTCKVFNDAMHDRLSDIMGEQARQVATSLSLTSERMARAGDWEELNRRARELIKSRNILFVGFLDVNARGKTLASRDLDFGLANLIFDSESLMQVSRRRSPTFGEYLQVMAPILSTPSPPGDPAGTVTGGPRLVGYVAVGISQGREEAQVYRVHYLILGIACVMVIAALPVALILVHRIFLPIRKLVTVARKITGGDLDARVEIHRPDVIGDLARAFDEMVMRVKEQQEALADANHDLEHKIELRTSQLELANNRLT